MSKIKVIYIDKKQNSIEFTKKELEDLLEQTYNDGWHDGYNSSHLNYTYTTQSSTNTSDMWKYPSISYCDDSATIAITDINGNIAK